jgi:hypothetical protein
MTRGPRWQVKTVGCVCAAVALLCSVLIAVPEGIADAGTSSLTGGSYLKCVGSYAAIGACAITPNGCIDLSAILVHWNGTKWREVNKAVACSADNPLHVPHSLYFDRCLVS